MHQELVQTCSEIIDLIHVNEVVQRKAIDMGGRAEFYARKQYVMSEADFNELSTAFTQMIAMMTGRDPDGIYTTERIGPHEFTYRFKLMQMSLTYNTHLGGAFCVVEDAWDAVDAAALCAQNAIEKMLRTH